MDKLKWFSGTWSCEGQFAGGMGMPAHPTKARVTTKSDLDGFFYSVRYEEEKTKDNPMPYRGAGFWGYDRETKKYTSIWADNMGGGAPQTSAGWEGDKLVFSGDATMMGKKMGVRDTFTRKGDNELVHMGEMQMDGKWSKMSEETCKKSAGMR
ncbi:MAG TPA: DUF1579 family protein [Vicinamibacteria bacterium]|nr:DUF1579 family protein [Vicinamibacteria bacterium]